MLTVVFVGPRKMRALNRRYRNRDCATDVLSFSYGEEIVEGRPCLGEVVIAPHIAWENAEQFGQEPASEVVRLLVHGILHLLGHDHESDGGEMNRIQRRLLRAVRTRAFPAPAKPRAGP